MILTLTVGPLYKRINAILTPEKIIKNGRYLVDDISQTLFISYGQTDSALHITAYREFDDLNPAGGL